MKTKCNQEEARLKMIQDATIRACYQNRGLQVGRKIQRINGHYVVRFRPGKGPYGLSEVALSAQSVDQMGKPKKYGISISTSLPKPKTVAQWMAHKAITMKQRGFTLKQIGKKLDLALQKLKRREGRK